jgi:hypothetical protein
MLDSMQFFSEEVMNNFIWMVQYEKFQKV